MEASRNKPDGQRLSTGIRTVAFHVVDPGLSLGTTYSPKHIALRMENKETTEIKAVVLGVKRDSEPPGDPASHTMCPPPRLCGSLVCHACSVDYKKQACRCPPCIQKGDTQAH